MKTKMSSYMFAFCMVLNTLLFAHSLPESVGETEEKLYLEFGDIQIVNRDIFLNIDGNLLPITTVSKDEKGTYVTVNPAAVDVVICSRCKKEYDADNQSSKCPHGWLLNRPHR